MIARPSVLWVLAALGWCGCQHTAIIGSTLECQADVDCSPPQVICSADGRCVPGCLDQPTICVAGSTCDATTGECAGGSIIGKPCGADTDCAPPDLVCKKSSGSGTCVAGCDLNPTVCYNGWICDYANGRCCDPHDDECHVPGAVAGCDADTDCTKGMICFVGTCVPGCAQSGCSSPMNCGADGHCGPASGTCARDADCDGGSFCSRAGHCAVLPAAAPVACAGGTNLTPACNDSRSPAALSICAGAAGPASCPYCIDDSCYHPGECATATDCHLGDNCTGGLCRPALPACATLVAAAAVVGGGFAAGRELCVRDAVSDLSTAANGNILFRIGKVDLPAEITPLYQAAGIARPTSGTTITVHGVARWDESHARWELMPVDWWSL